MAKQQETHAHPQETYTRFAAAQRIEHIVLVLSFSLLGLTGLIQKFMGNPIAEGIIGLLGGIETVRIIHRVAALVFALQSIYHITVLAYKVFVKHIELTMLPGLGDVINAIDVVRYNLGLTKQHPKLPRYNFAEKAEYWAMIWGGVVMGLTGFMLWNPIATAKFLPGQAIPAAKAAHGAEAILAVLAIFVWHFYNVHLKMFNKSMFTGKMTRHQMEEEHGEELERLLSGKTRPPADPKGVHRRERIFVPIIVVAGLLVAVGLIWFATFEETAIATLPEPATPVEVFAPLTPTPVPVSTVENNELGSAVPHPVEGDTYKDCTVCHGVNGVQPYPEDHAGRPTESCLICHKQGPPSASGTEGAVSGSGPKAIPHPIEGDTYKDCTTCHGEGKLKPFPKNHASFTADSCTMCHQVAASGTSETGGADGAAKAIPHPIEGDAYKDCTTCHGADKMKPFPANHASFAADSCTTCHQPAAASSGTTQASGGPAIPHSLEGEIFNECTYCHGADRAKPFPENHASFTNDSCRTCHQPAQ